MSDHFEYRHDLQKQPALHPRAIRHALERLLEQGWVRPEEPEALAQFLNRALLLPEQPLSPPLEEEWLEKLWSATTPAALDQNLRLWLRQASIKKWLEDCSNHTP